MSLMYKISLQELQSLSYQLVSTDGLVSQKEFVFKFYGRLFEMCRQSQLLSFLLIVCAASYILAADLRKIEKFFFNFFMKYIGTVSS